ncbi:MAG: SDR family oxidoreductase [Thauera sp.]|nr:SDR family oxidoreductase [Thauera sp.]MDX9884661.1 SDR family oxidoreductase [Thauera sp.]
MSSPHHHLPDPGGLSRPGHLQRQQGGPEVPFPDPGGRTRPQGIRVNSIAPDPIGTPLWGTVGPPPEVLGAVAGKINSRLMPGAFGEPQDITEPSVFMCSAEPACESSRR